MTKSILSSQYKNNFLTLHLALLALAVLAGCGGDVEGLTSLSEEEILATAEVLASTAIAESAQAIPATATQTQTAVPSMTPLPTPTPTATEVITKLTTNLATNCRNGPGIEYMVVLLVEEGRSLAIEGRNDASTWWLMEPQELDDGCWVFGNLVTVEGPTESLPVVVSLALPLVGNDPKYILYFLIAEDTGGTVACGDSLVALNTGILRSGDAAVDAKKAMSALLLIGSPYVSGYRHSGYQSNLQVVSAIYNGGTQEVIIYLSGTVIKPQDNCDKERFRVQIFATAQQFDNVTKAYVWVGTIPIGDFLVQN